MADIMIYTDGGSRGNPGPAAIAVLIYDGKGKLLASHSEYIGEATNNVAEYRAVLKALKLAKRHGAGGSVSCVMDSELVARQLSGKYKVKKPHLLELYSLVKDGEKAFSSVSYANVRREDEKISLADYLLNASLDRMEAKRR
ncbi:MAG: ribonuclease HI family protein [Candidatus Aenigmatarchaeota archaeon]